MKTTNYCFAADGERRLTEWMERHLYARDEL